MAIRLIITAASDGNTLNGTFYPKGKLTATAVGNFVTITSTDTHRLIGAGLYRYDEVSIGSTTYGDTTSLAAALQLILPAGGGGLTQATADGLYFPLSQTTTKTVTPANNTTIRYDLTWMANTRDFAARQLILYGNSVGGAAYWDHADITRLMDTPLLSLKQRRDTGSDYPAFISMSASDFTRAHGRIMRQVNRSVQGASRVQDIVKSIYPSTAPSTLQAVGYDLVIMLDETPSTTAVKAVGFRVSVSANNPAQPTRHYSSGFVELTDPDTRVFEVTSPRNESGVFGYPGSGKDFFNVRMSGDMHTYGAYYIGAVATAGAAPALTLDKEMVIYTGGAGSTLTIPDPTVADNLGRTHILCNYGTADLTLSRAVYLDAATPLLNNLLSYTHPANKLRIYCDGAKWIAIP